MAALLKLKQVRNVHRTRTKKLMDKSETDINYLQELKTLLASLKKKQETLENIDAEILQLLTEEDDIEKEIDESSEYTDRIIAANTKIELDIDRFNRKMKEDVKPVSPIVEKKPWVKSESQINLPKITLKVYDGSLLN